MKTYGTGRASRPAAGAPTTPIEAGPRPGGDLDKPVGAVRAAPGADAALPPINVGPDAGAMPPDEPPAGDAGADADPFNP
jgi:hypothetical protein